MGNLFPGQGKMFHYCHSFQTDIKRGIRNEKYFERFSTSIQFKTEV